MTSSRKNNNWRKIVLVSACLLIVNTAFADIVQIFKDSVILDNGLVSRSIKIENGVLNTTNLSLGSQDKFYSFPDESDEFALLVNDKKITGRSGWKLQRLDKISDEKGGEGAAFIIQHESDSIHIQLVVNYLLYDDSPVIRKWIDFTNLGENDIKIEAIDIESFKSIFSKYFSTVYHNYGRMRASNRFVGQWDDPVLVVHDPRNNKGIALGNEAVGVLKRTAYHPELGTHDRVEIGTTHLEDDFPFRKWLKKGETWNSYKTFICPFEGYVDGFQVINNEVNEFVIKYMGTRITDLAHKPVFVYNTWYPFRFDVTDSLVAELADAAADCGIQEFVIDDGWQTNSVGGEAMYSYGDYGDWNVNTQKFKGGLKPTFDYIKSKGMKPGLWVSVGAVTPDAKVYTEHPEWLIRDKDGNVGNIHNDLEGFNQASFGTDWKDYIRDIIQGLVSDYGLAYAKLDLAVVTSPYVNDDTRAGSYATDHPYHRDQRESYVVLYQRLLDMFDELHEESPELFIDCTYETAGKDQLMDYAIAKHAEGNWLSNFEIPGANGALRIRHMGWWRSPAVPASSLVIGSYSLEDPEIMFGLKSLIGTLPIVLGDPRKLSVEKRAEIKSWSLWMQSMQDKYDYMKYRKDLVGFGEPKIGHWDGWQRINFETEEGGIFGVFKQAAADNQRRVTLLDLKPDEKYLIKEAPTGKVVHKATGKSLMTEGFVVKIEKETDARIFEVTLN